MKLTTFILMLSLMQVSAASFAQKISLEEKNTALKTVLLKLRGQTGYDFIYDAKLIAGKEVSIKLQNVTLDEALHAVFKAQNLDYSVKDKFVLITLKKVTILDELVSVFAIIDVQGRVVDNSGKPLPGANISVISGKKAVTTNSNGEFYLIGLNEKSVLEISYIGHLTRKVKVKANLGDIVLQPRVDSLQEVKIIIGYGTTTQRFNTGNVSVITSEDIAEQPVSNVLQALQNRVPGMVVTQTNGFSSAPYNVKIRGQNDVATSGTQGVNRISEPLYIIDGVPLIRSAVNQTNVGINQNSFPGPTFGQSPLFALNPTDVESISFLKDADATAIYGARGANGVILITTKKGREGLTSFTGDVKSGVSLQTRKLNLMKTPEYLEMRRQAFINDQLSPEDYNAFDLRSWDQNRYTDWQKELLQTARTTDAQLSLSGGDQRNTFRLSGGFNRQSPPFKGDYKEQRASGSLSVTNSSFNDKLQTSATVNFSATNTNLPSQDVTSLIYLAPNAPSLLDENGELNYEGWKAAGGYPFAAVNIKRPYEATTTNLISNLTLNYEILSELKFSSSFGYNFSKQDQLAISPSNSFNPAYNNLPEANFGNNDSRTWIIEPALNWRKQQGKHTVETLLGATFQDAEIKGDNITARGYTSDALLGSLGAAGSYNALSNYLNTRFQSLYARINYNFSSKYIINLNGRRDGSSRFATGKKFGNFGSIGAAWIFSEETFMREHLSFLSLAKLRASYGLVGGDGLGDYQYLSSFSSGTNPYQGTPVLQLSRLANDQFSWTTNKKIEVALALNFFQNRISTEFSIYRNRAGDQLVSDPLPATAGFPSIIANLPALIENAGWEFSLQSFNINARNFRWSSDFNISRNSNKLLEFPSIENTSYFGRYAIGRSITSQGMYSYAGVDPQTGAYTFHDLNGDGTVDLYGNKDYIYKNTDPSFFGGLNNSFSYKKIQLSFFLAFTKQKGVLRLSNQFPGSLSYDGMGNQLVLSEQLSGKPPIENLTTASYRIDLNDYYMSDAVWVDASYIRLQNVSLAYNMPDNVLQPLRMQSLKIYMQAQNLLTITNYKGTDPASPGSFSLPPRKIITAGIQLGF